MMQCRFTESFSKANLDELNHMRATCASFVHFITGAMESYSLHPSTQWQGTGSHNALHEGVRGVSTKFYIAVSTTVLVVPTPIVVVPTPTVAVPTPFVAVPTSIVAVPTFIVAVLTTCSFQGSLQCDLRCESPCSCCCRLSRAPILHNTPLFDVRIGKCHSCRGYRPAGRWSF
jgi:hypothetical protein